MLLLFYNLIVNCDIFVSYSVFSCCNCKICACNVVINVSFFCDSNVNERNWLVNVFIRDTVYVSCETEASRSDQVEEVESFGLKGVFNWICRSCVWVVWDVLSVDVVCGWMGVAVGVVNG